MRIWVLGVVVLSIFSSRAESQSAPPPTTISSQSAAQISEPAFSRGFDFGYRSFSAATPAPLRVGKSAKQTAGTNDATADLVSARESLEGTWARIEKDQSTATAEQQGLAIGASLALALNAQTVLVYAGLDKRGSSTACQIPNNSQKMGYFDANDRSLGTAEKRVRDTIQDLESAKKCIEESQYQQGTGQKTKEHLARFGIGAGYHDKNQQVANLNAQHDAKIGDSLKKYSGQFEGVLNANGYPQ